MNFTKEEIQDLEDAIFYTGILFAQRQENLLTTEAEIKTMGRFVTRLLRLKTKLSEPVRVLGGN